jgi:hypothetical protein
VVSDDDGAVVGSTVVVGVSVVDGALDVVESVVVAGAVEDELSGPSVVVGVTPSSEQAGRRRARTHACRCIREGYPRRGGGLTRVLTAC